MSGIRNPHVVAMKALSLLERGYSIDQVVRLLGCHKSRSSIQNLKKALKRLNDVAPTKRVDDGARGKVRQRQRED